MVLRLKDKLFQKVGLVFKRSFKKGDYYRRFIFPTESLEMSTKVSRSAFRWYCFPT